MMRKPRVGMVLQGLGLGGAERLVIDLVGLLPGYGVEPIIITASRGWPEADALRTQGVHVTELSRRPGPDIGLLWSLVNSIRKLNLDVVHTHTFAGSTYGRIAAKLARVPILVHTEHAVWAPSSAYRRAKYLFPLLTRITDMTVAFSEVGSNQLLDRGWAIRDRVCIIPNGVPVPVSTAEDVRSSARLSLGLRSSDIVFMAIGGLRREKRLDRFIDAVSIAASRVGERICGLIVGDGPERKALEESIRCSHAPVRLLGEVPRARALIGAADALVNTSDWEGMPIAVLEAMAQGVAVITTWSEGAVALSSGGGIVVERSPESVADALCLLATNAPFRNRLGDEARAMVSSQFSIKICAQKHASLYVSLMSD